MKALFDAVAYLRPDDALLALLLSADSTKTPYLNPCSMRGRGAFGIG